MSDCDSCGGTCSGCGQDCSCDTHAAHDAAVEVSLRDFLRYPGPAPAHFTAEQIERSTRAIVAARKEASL